MDRAATLPDADATRRQLLWLLAGLVLTWLGCEVAAWAGVGLSPLVLVGINLIDQPHLPVALAGMFAFYLCSNPAGKEILATLAAAGVLGGGVRLLVGLGGYAINLAFALCAGLGLASLGALLVRAWRVRGSEGRLAFDIFLTACLVLGAIPLIFFFLLVTIQLHPTTLDAVAYAADGTLGTQVTFVLGRWFAAVPALALLAGVVYVTLPLAFMVLVVLHLRASGPPVRDVLPAFFCVALAGFAIYNFFPVVGPLFAFADSFPHATPPVSPGPLAMPEVPRNCMPSLHTAWALMIWWHARPLPRWARAGAGIYLAFTVLATVGYGAHYAFDVVVAFPSTMACQALCLPVPPSAAHRRRAAVLWGVGLTLLWLGLLRWGLPVLALSPWLTAPAALLTVVVSVVKEQGLYRSAGTLAGDTNSTRNACPGVPALETIRA